MGRFEGFYTGAESSESNGGLSDIDVFVRKKHKREQENNRKASGCVHKEETSAAGPITNNDHNTTQKTATPAKDKKTSKILLTVFLCAAIGAIVTILSSFEIDTNKGSIGYIIVAGVGLALMKEIWKD